MSCERMRELAWLSVDEDALDEAERREFETHARDCADCRAARDHARRVRDGLRALPVPPVPLGFAERTLRRMDPADPDGPRRILGLPTWCVPAAAALLAAVFLYWVESKRLAPPPATELADAPREEGARYGEPGRSKSPAAETAKPAEPATLRKLGFGGGQEKDASGAGADRDDRGRDGAQNKEEAAAPAPGFAAPSAAGGRVDGQDEVLKLAQSLRDGSASDALALLSSPAPAAPAAPAAETRKTADDESPRDQAVPARSEESAPARPVPRFLRLTGDADRIAALLPKDAARDAEDRLVFDAPEPDLRTLERRLRRAGVKVTGMTDRDWLAASRTRSAQRSLRLGRLDGPAEKPVAVDAADKSGLAKQRDLDAGAASGGKGAAAPSAPSRGKSVGAPTGGGGESAAPPVLRVRWFVLLGED